MDGWDQIRLGVARSEVGSLGIILGRSWAEIDRACQVGEAFFWPSPAFGHLSCLKSICVGAALAGGGVDGQVGASPALSPVA